MERMTSKGRMKAADELAAFISKKGGAEEFMAQFHPEDAVLINDMAFAKLYESNIYSVRQADADCLPFLMRCSPEFVQTRKEMGRHLETAFNAWIEVAKTNSDDKPG